MRQSVANKPKKTAPQIVARLVLMQEHLVCLICLLIFQLKNRLQLCSHSSPGWEIPKHMLQISETTTSGFYQAEIHSQFISQKCRNKMKTIREHGRNIKDTKLFQNIFAASLFVCICRLIPIWFVKWKQKRCKPIRNWIVVLFYEELKFCSFLNFSADTFINTVLVTGCLLGCAKKTNWFHK